MAPLILLKTIKSGHQDVNRGASTRVFHEKHMFLSNEGVILDPLLLKHECFHTNPASLAK